ncbi:MAG: TetR/AcrR family transcriptional regulator [Proteobacteria bacterium]|nr:TetR/AcrR family transcriptional regulator [Pseudomonadota bacterium]
MAKASYQRRKEDRPAEITEAAMEAFAERGFTATKVEDVAKRAGVSKGLLYLYFKTKEDLFKAVVRNFISPKVDALIETVESTELSAEAFLRGPFLAFAKSVPRSPIKVLVRLLVSEGPKHPDLVEWYWDNVVSRGLAALRSVIRKGVDRGEFRQSALDDLPHILMAPVVFSVLWKILFDRHDKLDTDRLIAEHIEFVLNSIRKT